MHRQTEQNPLLAFNYAVLASLSFVIMSAFIKTLGEVSLIQVIFARAFVAFLLIWAFVSLRGDEIHLRTWKLHLLRGALGCSAMFCFFYSLRHVPLVEVTSLGYSTPVFVAALSMLFLGEKLFKHRSLSLLLSSLGVLLVLRPGFNALPALSLLVIVGSVFRAGAIVCIRQLTLENGAMLIVLYFLAFASILSGCMLPLSSGIPSANEFTRMLLVGFFGAFGQAFMVLSYSCADATFVGALGYLGLLWSGLIGFAFFSEVPHWIVLSGAVLLVVSQIVLVVRERQMRVEQSTTTATTL